LTPGGSGGHVFLAAGADGGLEQSGGEYFQDCQGLLFIQHPSVGGGNSNIFGIFTPKLGEDFRFDSYFSNGLNPPTSSDNGQNALRSRL